MIRFSITCSGHTQPPPPVSTVPRTRSLTSVADLAVFIGNVVHFGVQMIENWFPAVRSGPFLYKFAHFGNGNDRVQCSLHRIPGASPRLASGSTSAARTGLPSAAYRRARVAANVVLPTPAFSCYCDFHFTSSTFVIIYQIPRAVLFSSILSIIRSTNFSISVSNCVSSAYPFSGSLCQKFCHFCGTCHIGINTKEGIDTGSHNIVADGNCFLRHPLRSASYYRKLVDLQACVFCELCGQNHHTGNIHAGSHMQYRRGYQPVHRLS